jgi:parvulin-like peptidyl-prolyl isomerase
LGKITLPKLGFILNQVFLSLAFFFSSYVQFMSIDFNVRNEDIIAFLKKNFTIKEIYNLILSQRIIEQTCQTNNINITENEIQIQADNFRREHKLEKYSDTMNWLKDQQVTDKYWEKSIIDQLLRIKLKNFLFSEEIIAKYFAQNQLNFSQIILYHIIVQTSSLAQEIFYQIEEKEISFYQAANLYDVDENRRLKFGYEGILYRQQLKPEVAAVVFSLNIEETTLPIKTEIGYHLFLVQKFIKPELTTEIKNQIQENLFQQWLNQQLNYLITNN